MQKIHTKLTQKYPAYNNWHQTKHCNKIHWGVLVVFTFLVFGTILRWTPITFAADIAAPSVPTNLTATPISSSQINLSWSASTDDVGVASYKIYRCAGSACAPTTQIATSAVNSYSDTGLIASTAYTYAVSAYDAVGNESGKSISASAATLISTGNTYYISPSGNDTTGNGTSANPWATLSKAFGQMQGGDTLIIKDGIYKGVLNAIHPFVYGEMLAIYPPSGTPGNYTVIRAENEGQVTFDGEGVRGMFFLGNSPQYLQFQGIKWINPSGDISVVLISGGNHIKILRSGAGNNINNRGETQSFNIMRSSYVLLEDVYAWGAGRYKFAFFLSDHLICRRCVARTDATTGVVGTIASVIAVFQNYCSQYVEYQNSIAIDTDTPEYWTNYYELHGGFTAHSYCEPPADEYSENTDYRGSIALNVKQNSVLTADTSRNFSFRDFVGWDTLTGFYPRTPIAPYNYTINHSLFGNMSTDDGIMDYSNNTVVSNSIFYKNKRYGLGGVANSNYNSLYFNGTDYFNTSPGPNDLSTANGNAINPITGTPGNGVPALKYLLRVEDGSNLDGAASDGGDIGPTILTKIGVSGTMYGDPGYNTDTGEPLWPFPYEDTIKQAFASYNPGGADTTKPDGKRGFAADGNDQFGKPLTLTRYIWQYLGNQIPCEIYNECGGTPDITVPSTPANLTATTISSSQINLSWTASTDDVGVVGYKIYRCAGSGCTPTTQIATSTTNSYSNTGLTASTAYTYAVSAYDAAGNESNKSTLVSATTQIQTGNVYYISPTGSNTNNGSELNPWATLKYAFSRMAGGDTLIIKDGTYTGINNVIDGYNAPPNGSPSGYTIIKAEQAGKVTFDGNNTLAMFDIQGGSHNYLQFEGLKWINSPGHGLQLANADHVKFLKCGAESNMWNDNRHGIQIARSTNILLEDCYVWGQGRFGISIFISQYVIVRRTVVRLDAINANGMPIAHFMNYSSGWVECQNCIAIDSDSSYFTNFYEVEGSFTTHNAVSGTEYWPASHDSFWRGSIGLNVHHNTGSARIGGMFFDDTNNLTYENMVLWDVQNVGMWGKCVNCSWNHFTIGKLQGLNSGFPEGKGWDGRYGTSDSLTNSIIYGANLYGLWRIENSNYNVMYNNAKNYYEGSPGANDMAIENGNAVDPIDGNPGNGIPALKYLLKIENGSDLDGRASDGGDIGPTILKRIGVSGTLYGEPGYNEVTNEDLWPFPYEDQIKSAFASYNPGGTDTTKPNGKRGFAADGAGLYGGPITLTSYIWEYLGNPCPAGICVAIPDTTPPSTPATLTATAISSSQINLSWNASTDNVGVTGYKIYRCSGSGCTPTIQIATSTTNSYSNTGLTASTTYTYAVSAYDAAGNESEKSSFVSATTFSQFKQTDFNKDGVVNQLDFDILKQDWNRTDRPVSDLNQDGVVDSRDLGIMMGEWGDRTSLLGDFI